MRRHEVALQREYAFQGGPVTCKGYRIVGDTVFSSVPLPLQALSFLSSIQLKGHLFSVFMVLTQMITHLLTLNASWLCLGLVGQRSKFKVTTEALCQSVQLDICTEAYNH